jgi:gliding motility-associated-like protein
VKLLVTDPVGCQDSAFANVDVIAISIATITHDTTVCLETPMEMSSYVTSSGTFKSISYAWTCTPVSANLSTNTDSVTYFWGVGDFLYTVTATTDPLGCTAYDTETVHSMPPLKMTGITAKQTIMFGSSAMLSAYGADFFTWYPNDGTISNNTINDPIVTPIDSTTYMVVGSSIYGCLDTEYVTVLVDKGTDQICPSAFSPNNDGLNDKFHVVNIKYQKLVEFRVFDRWGVELFETNDPAEGWDVNYKGVPQDLGTYYYEVILAFPDRSQKIFTGTFLLLR